MTHIKSYGTLKYRSPNLDQKTRPNNNQQKEETCKNVDFAVPADHRIKPKEYEKKNRYLDLARELKKLWNMKVTITPIVIGAFDAVRIIKRTAGIGSQRTSGDHPKATALLRTTRILRKVVETWGDLLSLKLLWKTIS